MKSESLSAFHQQLTDEGIYLCYKGPIWQELLEELTEVVKTNRNSKLIPSVFGRNLNLFIELVQNVIRYSSSKSRISKEIETGRGIVVIGSKNGKNYFQAGNTIDSYHKGILEEAIENLKSCSKEELGQLYKAQLRGHVHKKGKGAGLGMIDIFRKSDIVDCHFSRTDSNEDFFSIKAEFSI